MWAIETRNTIVLENLPKWTPERMIKDVKDKQLRLRIYRAAFASMKRAIMEKAREYGVPVILVNPPHISTICPIHGARIIYQPDGGNAPRVSVYEKGEEKRHRDVVSLYNLRRRAGDGSPMPLGSTGTHDSPTIKLGRWLGSRSLHSMRV